MPPTIALIGSEYEENLSLRYLASSVALDGVESVLVPFNEAGRLANVVSEVMRVDPFLVGISVPFQSRAPECLALAATLRRAGSQAHLTLGGHFATFEYDNILRHCPAVDSVVRHEGESTLRELCGRLLRGEVLAPLSGAIVRGPDGPVDGGKRRLTALDDLPFPDRRGTPREVMGIRVAPLVGSRGCYADCSFCCIYAYAENADGARYRRRSVESIADEMAREYHGRGTRLFVFHDDNFFVPSADQNLRRYSRLKELLDAAGVADIGLVIKCRPNDVTPDLFALLKSMGLMRAYVGIETNSDEGIVSLNRRITAEDNRRALSILRALEVHLTFNVLIFDPEATLEGIERNIEFIEAFSDIPSNFCRAEVYAGTPLKEMLERDGRLQGNYLAWNYSMRDPRVEVLFRMAVTVFAARNFRHDGVANLNMGIRGDNELMRRFYPAGWDRAWNDRLVDYSRRITSDSMAVLGEMLAFARADGSRDAARVKGLTASLARRVARADLAFVNECRALRRELEGRIRQRAGIHFDSAFVDEMAPWAAETGRFGSSVGLEVSTELLPAPLSLRPE
ncbi:MAG TPA: radical SAM protein [Gemmatimonadaceae bacterium]